MTCNDLLYRLTVINSHPTDLKLKITFKPKCDEKEIDLVWPRGGIKDFVKKDTTCQIVTLIRKNPFADHADDANEIEKLEIDIQW